MIIKDLQITQNLIIGASGSGVQFPTTDGLPGYLLTTDGSGVVAWGPGTPGPTGPTGPFGGPQGPTGFQGATGPFGGPQGVTGPQGRTGSQGSTGFQGRTGPQGTTGFQGGTGAQGNTGPQGLAGTPGGAQGPVGYQGPFGPQGDVGPQGDQGYQGPQGFQGAGGTITILNDTFTSSDTITITHSLGYYPVVQVLNDIYEEIIPVSVTHNTVNDFTVILATSSSGLIITGAGGEGPQGNTGPQGVQGDQGNTGPQGIQGDQGVQGDQGPVGITGSDGPNSIRLIFGASASGSPSATGSFNISGGLSFSEASFLFFNAPAGFTTDVYDIYGNPLYTWLSNILNDTILNKTINAQISEVGNPSNYGIYIAYPSIPTTFWSWSLTFVSGGGTFSTDKIYTISAVSAGVQGPTGATGPSGGPIGPTGPQGSVGSTGPQGSVGSTGAAGSQLIFQSAWQTLPSIYGPDEYVTYGGSTWFTYIGALDGVPPSPTNSNWNIFAGAALIVDTSIPTSSADTGSKGEIRVANGEYLYIHTGDQWLKSSMTFSTF